MKNTPNGTVQGVAQGSSYENNMASGARNKYLRYIYIADEFQNTNVLPCQEHLYIEILVGIKIILNLDPALNKVIAQNANFLAKTTAALFSK